MANSHGEISSSSMKQFSLCLSWVRELIHKWWSCRWQWHIFIALILMLQRGSSVWRRRGAISAGCSQGMCLESWLCYTTASARQLSWVRKELWCVSACQNSLPLMSTPSLISYASLHQKSPNNPCPPIATFPDIFVSSLGSACNSFRIGLAQKVKMGIGRNEREETIARGWCILRENKYGKTTKICDPP